MNEAELLAGQQQTEVSLGETLNPAAKSSLDLSQIAVRNMHRHKSTLVEIYPQANRVSELVQQLLQAHSSRQARTHDDT